MNLILLFQDDFIEPDRVTLKERRAEHIFNVHRAKIGDLLTVGLLNDKIGTGKVLSMDSVKREVQLEVILTNAPPPSPTPYFSNCSSKTKDAKANFSIYCISWN